MTNIPLKTSSFLFTERWNVCPPFTLQSIRKVSHCLRKTNRTAPCEFIQILMINVIIDLPGGFICVFSFYVMSRIFIINKSRIIKIFHYRQQSIGAFSFSPMTENVLRKTVLHGLLTKSQIMDLAVSAIVFHFSCDIFKSVSILMTAYRLVNFDQKKIKNLLIPPFAVIYNNPAFQRDVLRTNPLFEAGPKTQLLPTALQPKELQVIDIMSQMQAAKAERLANHLKHNQFKKMVSQIPLEGEIQPTCKVNVDNTFFILEVLSIAAIVVGVCLILYSAMGYIKWKQQQRCKPLTRRQTINWVFHSLLQENPKQKNIHASVYPAFKPENHPTMDVVKPVRGSFPPAPSDLSKTVNSVFTNLLLNNPKRAYPTKKTLCPNKNLYTCLLYLIHHLFKKIINEVR